MTFLGRRWIAAVSTLLLSSSLWLMSGCSEPPPPEKKIPVLHIDSADPQAFVRHFVSDYLNFSDELVAQYHQFKAEQDAYGFVLYRNLNWTPNYIESKRSYEATLFDQKAYIYRHQLNELFDLFFELQKLSLLLKHSLLDEDWALEQEVMVRITKDRLRMMKYLRVENIGKDALHSSVDG